LGSQINVLYIAFEFAPVPQFFFYIDYIPRSDLAIDLDAIDRHYEPVNSTFLQLKADARLHSFISRSLYIRQIQSSISLCYTCSVTEETLNLVRTLGPCNAGSLARLGRLG
jgi:hypothetical protein